MDPLTLMNMIGAGATAFGQVAGGIKTLFGGKGGWGPSGQSQSSGGSTQGGAGHSESGSTSGTNDEQIQKWLEGAYQYQKEEGERQSQFNWRSMLMQMGYNTMSAIGQGIYNHIENTAAMNYNSAEALANRNWQEKMSNTSYQRAVEDMRKAGLNPILAFQNGGASTPGGSAGTISGASMGLSSSSALGVSRSGGFVPNSNRSESWSQSDWYNAAQSWNQMLSSTGMSPYGMQKRLTEIGKGTERVIDNATGQSKTGSYGEKRKPGDYLR